MTYNQNDLFEEGKVLEENIKRFSCFFGDNPKTFVTKEYRSKDLASWNSGELEELLKKYQEFRKLINDTCLSFLKKGEVFFKELISNRQSIEATPLAPCPMCGGEATIEERYDNSSDYQSSWETYYHIGCKEVNCFCYVDDGPTFPSRANAIEAWNKRTKDKIEEE